MATQPIPAYTLASATSTNDVEVPDDPLTLIFSQVLKTSISSLQTLALVCRRWKELCDRTEMGREVFWHACIPFPHDHQGAWQDAFRIAIGNRFVDTQGQIPTRTIIPYPHDLMVTSDTRAAWIADKGFVHFGLEASFFSVFLFETPTVKMGQTDGNIFALTVINDKIVCGFLNGDVSFYSLETLELTHKAHIHPSPVSTLLGYKYGVISVCNQQVKHTSFANRETLLLMDLPEVFEDNEFKVQLVNHRLYFTCYELESNSYYMLPLEPLSENLLKIKYPQINHPHLTDMSSISGWAGRTVCFDGESTMHYINYSKQPIQWNPHHQQTFINQSFHFRGDVALIVSPVLLQQDEINYDDLNESELSAHRLALIDLRGEHSLFWEYEETSLVASYDADDSNSHVFTIIGNTILFLRKKTSEVVRFTFPLGTGATVTKPPEKG